MRPKAEDEPGTQRHDHPVVRPAQVLNDSTTSRSAARLCNRRKPHVRCPDPPSPRLGAPVSPTTSCRGRPAPHSAPCRHVDRHYTGPHCFSPQTHRKPLCHSAPITCSLYYISDDARVRARTAPFVARHDAPRRDSRPRTYTFVTTPRRKRGGRSEEPYIRLRLGRHAAWTWTSRSGSAARRRRRRRR
jgi:hypothetical protein